MEINALNSAQNYTHNTKTRLKSATDAKSDSPLPERRKKKNTGSSENLDSVQRESTPTYSNPIYTKHSKTKPTTETIPSAETTPPTETTPSAETTPPVNATAEPTRQRTVEEILQDEKVFVTPEPGRAWTDEEYREANIKLFWGRDTRSHEIDIDAYIKEKIRRCIEAEKDNQFNYVLRDFSEGIIDDGFGPRVYSGYDFSIFHKMATTFSEEREGLFNLKQNFSEYLPDEEFDNRLRKLYEQFDEAFATFADIMQGYAIALGVPTANTIGEDVKAYGELIKDYVCSGNSVPREGGSSELYEYLNKNSKAELSLNDINNIGKTWHSKFMG